MPNDLAGLDVVITGGTGALGAAVTRAMLATGANCHVTTRRSSSAADFDLTDHERVWLHNVELTDEAAVARLYADLQRPWASLHMAGGFTMSPLVETGVDTFRQMFDQNAVSCFLCCREAVRAMRERGGGEGGRIVNVAARPVLQPTGGMVAYTSAKAAVASLTQCLADELKGDRILVNGVLPSTINTPATREAMPDADHSKWPTPEEIAAVVAQLANRDNAAASGALVPVYGQV